MFKKNPNTSIDNKVQALIKKATGPDYMKTGIKVDPTGRDEWGTREQFT